MATTLWPRPSIIAGSSYSGRAIINPLVILLAALATHLRAHRRHPGSAVVMFVMIVLGVGLRFWQEAKADTAAAALKAMISVTATVVRGGTPREVPLAQVVPGDVVKLAAGDMIPADLRLLVLQRPVLDPGQPHRRIVSGREIRGPGTAESSARLWNSRTSAFSARASKAARRQASSRPPGRTPISAAWPRRSSASRCRRASTAA